MRNTPYKAALILIGLALASCSQHIVSNPEVSNAPLANPAKQLQKISNLSYSPADWPKVLQGDIYRPDNTEIYPGVLLIHGGGWSSRSRQDTDKLAQQIAERGYVVFNISHRFAPQHQFPEQIYDVQLAIKWFRQHANDYQLDPNKIASWGYSSGAHLAAMLGSVSEGDPIDKPHGGPQTRVQAVVGGGTPADLRKYPDGKLVERFLGGTQAEKPAAYAAASPAYYVTPNDPPVFLYHGSLDTLVKPNQPLDFKKLLDNAGVANELYIQKFRGHTTAFLFDGAAVKKAIQFLDRHLKNQ